MSASESDAESSAWAKSGAPEWSSRRVRRAKRLRIPDWDIIKPLFGMLLDDGFEVVREALGVGQERRARVRRGLKGEGGICE